MCSEYECHWKKKYRANLIFKYSKRFMQICHVFLNTCIKFEINIRKPVTLLYILSNAFYWFSFVSWWRFSCLRFITSRSTLLLLLDVGLHSHILFVHLCADILNIHSNWELVFLFSALLLPWRLSVICRILCLSFKSNISLSR